MSESNHSSLYEIVTLENGDVALKRADESEEAPLVTIHFSEQAKYFLGDVSVAVAREMIEAGLDAVSELEECSSDEFDMDVAEPSPVLH